MLKSIKVADYMVEQPITLTPDMEINEAAKLLLKNRISGAPVVDAGGNLVGIFSEGDCLRSALSSGYYHETTALVADHMSTDVQTVTPEDSVLAVAEIFTQHRRRRLPVLKDGKLIGQISRRDALRAIEDFYD